MKTSGIWCLFFTLIGSSTASAAPLDLGTAFSGLVSNPAIQSGQRGTLRYVDLMVRSDETLAQATEHSFVTRLEVYKGQALMCSVQFDHRLRVRPGVFVARFQIFYPFVGKPAPPPGIVPPPPPPPVSYRLSGRIFPPDADRNEANDALEFSFAFPAGGNAPVCVKLP
jgi:hypothetical protein